MPKLPLPPLSCSYAGCSLLTEHHHYGVHLHGGRIEACQNKSCLLFKGHSVNLGEVDTYNVEIGDPVVNAAHELLSSMETWSTTPQDHRAETPARFVNMLRQMTTKPDDFKFTTFPQTDQTEMVTLGPIPFYTLCAHHVVPFFGYAWVGYIPRGKIVGLSKIPRTVEYLAKGFHVQETLTSDIADFLENKLDPLGVAVVLKAEHMCMAMRGVEVAGVITTTSAMRGVFADHERTAKAEFMQIMKG